MHYDWATEWPGVLARHADDCPFRQGEMCACGPLGYIAAIDDPDTGARLSSPLLETAEEARVWRSEQELAAGWQRPAAANANGNGNAPRGPAKVPAPEVTSAAVARGPTRRASPAREPTRRAPREVPAARTREVPAARPGRRQPPAPPAQEEYGVPVSELIERFLDAAEDGEARGRDGRPFSDDQLAEFEWGLTGYVGKRFGDVDAAGLRGRHVFQLIDELEDAGMPRSRLKSVVGALSAMFDYAADLDLVLVNPATFVALPGDERRPRMRLSETVETRAAPAPREAGGGFGDNVISEQTIWMLVKIVALIFICIALVLVAESV